VITFPVNAAKIWKSDSQERIFTVEV
jgi:hypothetical protein